jgi:hypothetical protein
VQRAEHPVETARRQDPGTFFGVPVRFAHLQAAEGMQLREPVTAVLDRLQIAGWVEGGWGQIAGSPISTARAQDPSMSPTGESQDHWLCTWLSHGNDTSLPHRSASASKPRSASPVQDS